MLLYVGSSSEEEAMPFGNLQSVIGGIHECFGDNQGLITVECMKTGSGEDAMYSIVKTVEPFEGPGCDDASPWHPLSICRHTVRDIVVGN